jgi:hypothetical protein
MARNVVQAVQTAILRGCILMTTKTKPLIPGEARRGGKQLASVGPDRTAVPSRDKYIVVGRAWDELHSSARSAAADYVGYVGRDHAWNSLRTARCGGSKKDLTK